VLEQSLKDGVGWIETLALTLPPELHPHPYPPAGYTAIVTLRLARHGVLLSAPRRRSRGCCPSYVLEA
jgi:hypothetical protein